MGGMVKVPFVNRRTPSSSILPQISEQLGGGGLSSELCQLVSQCMWVRREEIRSQLVRDSCAVSHSHLEDFDWKMKVREGGREGGKGGGGGREREREGRKREGERELGREEERGGGRGQEFRF